VKPLIGRTVQTTPPVYGNSKKPETLTGTVQATGWDTEGDCWFLVLLDDGSLDYWRSLDCKVLPESSLIPAWALPHIPAALGGALILAASIVGAYCLAGVM
jgi:hypothetical protein